MRHIERTLAFLVAFCLYSSVAGKYRTWIKRVYFSCSVVFIPSLCVVLYRIFRNASPSYLTQSLVFTVISVSSILLLHQVSQFIYFSPDLPHLRFPFSFTVIIRFSNVYLFMTWSITFCKKMILTNFIFSAISLRTS